MSDIHYALAGAGDIPGLVELLHLMHKENGVAPANWDKVEAVVRNVVETGAAVIALDGEDIVGSIGVVIQPLWYSDEQFVRDMWVFVHPMYRRTRIARTLFDMVVDFARGLERPAIFTVTSPKDTERKVEFYRRRFRSIGEVFIGA